MAWPCCPLRYQLWRLLLPSRSPAGLDMYSRQDWSGAYRWRTMNWKQLLFQIRNLLLEQLDIFLLQRLHIYYWLQGSAQLVTPTTYTHSGVLLCRQCSSCRYRLGNISISVMGTRFVCELTVAVFCVIDARSFISSWVAVAASLVTDTALCTAVVVFCGSGTASGAIVSKRCTPKVTAKQTQTSFSYSSCCLSRYLICIVNKRSTSAGFGLRREEGCEAAR